MRVSVGFVLCFVAIVITVAAVAAKYLDAFVSTSDRLGDA
jgi:hypothetical protein